MEFNLCLKNKIVEDEKIRWVEIYRITNITNNKVYIGQAISHRKDGKKYVPRGTEGRFKEHIRESTRKNKYHCNALNNAIRTYGIHNFIVEHLYNCKIEEANEMETFEIKKHNSLVPNGYNINTSCNSLLPSEEMREKISIGNIDIHLIKHLKKFDDYIFDTNEEDFHKYITPRTKYGKQIGWYIRLNKKVIEFVSCINSNNETKKRALEFLKLLKEESNKRQRAQIAGSSLEPLLPLTFGNICEELG
jgi:hypothetical protein